MPELGWHEEQLPDCKTPTVSGILMRGCSVDSLYRYLASSFELVNEKRACKESKDSHPPCHVFSRQYHRQQHPELFEVHERDGARLDFASNPGASGAGSRSIGRGKKAQNLYERWIMLNVIFLSRRTVQQQSSRLSVLLHQHSSLVMYIMQEPSIYYQSWNSCFQVSTW